LADFLRQPPELQTQPEKSPGLLVADIVLLLGLCSIVFFGSRRLRRSS
jgi:hypothetical protein